MSDDAPLMLSISGARGIVGKSMTPAVAHDFAAAFGSYVRSSAKQPQPTLCLGRDSRPSGEELASSAMKGLASVGCRVIDLGVVTTPTVAVMIGKHHASGGMVITASHNPIQWNGLKCLNEDGVAPPPEQCGEILERFRAKRFELVDSKKTPASATDTSSHETHVQRVLKAIDPAPTRKAKLRVVLDSVNGAGCVPGRMLLESLGCEVVHINGEPTGHFAHTPEPLEKNLDQLMRATAAEHAACGFAQDPDADRLVVVDENGKWIGEEFTLVLAVLRWLEMNMTTSQQVNKSSQLSVATNLSTSRMIDDVAAKFGAKVIRTAVGEANVVAGMKSAGAIIGGEGNGGVILPDVCWVRDSLTGMALILDLIVSRSSALSASSRGIAPGPPTSSPPLSSIIKEFPHYVMLKRTFDLKPLGGSAAISPALQRVKQKFAAAKLNTTDGARIDFEDGWVHLRPSNTEPIIRLIAEAKTEAQAMKLADDIAAAANL